MNDKTRENVVEVEDIPLKPSWWNNGIIQTLGALMVGISTVVTIAFAADERWAKNVDVSSQIESISEDFLSKQAETAAAVNELKVEVLISNRQNDKDKAETRLFSLQDRLAIVRNDETKAEIRSQIREQEARLRSLEKDIESLAQQKAEARVIRSSLTAPTITPLRIDTIQRFDQ